MFYVTLEPTTEQPQSVHCHRCADAQFERLSISSVHILVHNTHCWRIEPEIKYEMKIASYHIRWCNRIPIWNFGFAQYDKFNLTHWLCGFLSYSFVAIDLYTTIWIWFGRERERLEAQPQLGTTSNHMLCLLSREFTFWNLLTSSNCVNWR